MLLGAGDTVFCSRSFIPATLMAVWLLWLALRHHGCLEAIWWALASYYSVLLVLFASRALLPAMKGPLQIILGGVRGSSSAEASLETDKLR